MMDLSKRLCDTLKAHLDGYPVALPPPGALVWSWFLALCRTRPANGFGPHPISYGEIEAYARLYRWPIEPRHVDMILAMDRVWMDHARHNVGNSHTTPPPGPGVEMTPEAFDAVFA